MIQSLCLELYSRPWSGWFTHIHTHTCLHRILLPAKISSCISHGKGKPLCIYRNRTCKNYRLVSWKPSIPPADCPTEWLRAPHQISVASSIIERSQIIHKAVAYAQHPTSRTALLWGETLLLPSIFIFIFFQFLFVFLSCHLIRHRAWRSRM